MPDMPTIRSPHLDAVEVAWFSALCDDDFEFLGVQDERLRSTWQHCRDIVLAVDRLGFGNILLPSGYVLAKINRYIKMGMRAFIFSGYPHIEECERFVRHVLPQLRTCRLAP